MTHDKITEGEFEQVQTRETNAGAMALGRPATGAVVVNSEAFLAHAMQTQADPDALMRLMDFYERMKAREETASYKRDMAAFSADDMPALLKTKSDGKGRYKYAEIGKEVATVRPLMGNHGLSFRWRVKQGLVAGEVPTVSVRCDIMHRDGHVEEGDWLTSKHDTGGASNITGAASKNPHQELGSAITYLKRYTLELALGLASEADDDSNDSGAPRGGGSTDKPKGGKCPKCERLAHGGPCPPSARTMTTPPSAGRTEPDHGPAESRQKGQPTGGITQAQVDRLQSLAADPLSPESMKAFIGTIERGERPCDRAFANKVILRGKIAVIAAMRGCDPKEVDAADAGEYVPHDERDAKPYMSADAYGEDPSALADRCAEPEPPERVPGEDDDRDDDEDLF